MSDRLARRRPSSMSERRAAIAAGWVMMIVVSAAVSVGLWLEPEGGWEFSAAHLVASCVGYSVPKLRRSGVLLALNAVSLGVFIYAWWAVTRDPEGNNLIGMIVIPGSVAFFGVFTIAAIAELLGFLRGRFGPNP